MDLIGTLFPGLKARWLLKRAQLAAAQRLYSAAGVSQYHPRRGDNRSGNAVMEHARERLTNWARHLEENTDLAGGVLDDLTDRVVGTGITVEPQIRNRQGELLADLNEVVARAWLDWGRAPEASGVVPWGELQRLLFRSLMRDGEVLFKHLRGVATFKYRSPVPYALDPLESDYLPFDLTTDRVTHGIERDQWGTVTAYHLLRTHPGEYLIPLSPATLALDTIRIPATEITHLRTSRRLGQLRGVSIFHATVHRFQDLHDYEESERLAAKIAASFSAVIKKAPDMPGTLTRTQTDTGERNLEMTPAMIFDDLLPGESIETINSNRPSNALGEYRSQMLRAVSAGTGARYSTIARTWESSYTAMRQETVSLKPSARRLQEYFVARCVRLVYEEFVKLAELAGALDFGRADRLTMFDAEYGGPAEEWVDPLQETQADELKIQARIESRQSVQRRRGLDPRRMDAELEADETLRESETDETGNPNTPEPAATD
jgi:lambda family phage portal protein